MWGGGGAVIINQPQKRPALDWTSRMDFFIKKNIVSGRCVLFFFFLLRGVGGGWALARCCALPNLINWLQCDRQTVYPRAFKVGLPNQTDRCNKCNGSVEKKKRILPKIKQKNVLHLLTCVVKLTLHPSLWKLIIIIQKPFFPQVFFFLWQIVWGKRTNTISAFFK